MTLFFVRHGPVTVDPDRPAIEWQLRPDALARLAEWAEHLPQHPSALWVSSTEPKAIATAECLTRREVETNAGLGEVRRGSWSPVYDATVADLLAHPGWPPTPEWESAQHASARFAIAARRLATHAAPDVVIVTHGLVLTLLRAHLGGLPLTVRLWKDLAFPDVLMISESDRRGWVADAHHQCSMRRPDWLSTRERREHPRS